MYGFAAISHYNGWAMALVGLGIVFSGLIVLATTIAQLHKVLEILENPSAFLATFRKKEEVEETPEEDDGVPAMEGATDALRDSYRNFRVLVRTLPESVSLPRLLSMAEARGVFRCHATLGDLVRARVLVTDGDGFYNWNDAAYDRLMHTK